MIKLIKYAGVICLCFVATLSRAQLAADFTVDTKSGCAPIRVIFKDLSTGNPTKWKWDLGNGTISSAQNPSTTYFLPGLKTITLTVYKGTDSVATITKTEFILVFAKPTISFSASPTIGCLPMPVQFKDSSLPGTGVVNNWQWDFGDGNISNEKDPLHTYKINGTFKVTLIVRNSDGCVNSDSKFNYITANDSIRANFSFIPPIACTTPIPVRFTDKSIGSNITKWNWNFGDGTTSTTQSPTHNYLTKGVYDVTLNIENRSGCKDSIVIKNMVNAGVFKANFTDLASVCAGSVFTFNNSSTPAAVLDSTRWYFGDGTTANSISPLKVYSTPGSYVVKEISYFGACADSISKTLIVSKAPKAGFTASPRGICKPPLTVTFTNNSAGAANYLWDFGNGTTSTAVNPTYTFSNFGNYNIRLIADGGNGCKDILMEPNYIAIVPPNISGIEGAPYQGCFPYTATFKTISSAADSIVKYEWAFGDGSTSVLPTPNHTYNSPGEYFISVKITTVSGCESTYTTKIEGGEKPKSIFTGGPRLVCPDDIVFFDNTSLKAAKYFWQFGDGGTSVSAFPTHQYQDTGWMNVSLITINNGCNDTLEFRKYIYVNPPLARFKDSFSCSNQFEHFFTEEAVGATSWLWKFSQLDSTTERNPRHMFSDTGRQSFSLKVSDGICTHTASGSVLVLREKANFESIDSVNCTSTKVRFLATGPQTHQWNLQKPYQWDFGDGIPIYTDTNFLDRVFSTAGLFNLKLNINDLNNCPDSVSKPYQAKLFGPKADFKPRLQFACAGSILTFQDTSVYDSTNSIKKWSWDFGEGSGKVSFSSPPFSQIYPRPGVFDVKLQVEDSLGCLDSISIPRAVVVYQPTAAFNSPDTIVCVNSPVRFSNLSSGSILRYTWSFGNGLSSTLRDPESQYPKEGYYDIRLQVSDSLNCTDSLIKPKYIMVADAKASFSISDSFSSCPPLVVLFSNISTNNFQNYWNFGNGNTSTLTNPAHTYTLPGNFTATLKVVGNGGCSDSTSKQIKLEGPFGDIRYTPLLGCPPLEVSFASTAVNTYFYTWDFKDGTSYFSADSIYKHTYDYPGIFVPRLIVEDSQGCKIAVPGLDTIKVIGAKSYIRKTQLDFYCDSATVQFRDSTITNDGISSYNWDFGDGTQYKGSNPLHSYYQSGRYMARLEVITTSGCVTRDSTAVTVIVAKTPQLDIGSDSAVCLPYTVQHRVNWLNADNNFLSWKWSLGNGTTSTNANPPKITYSVAGNFNISVIGTNKYGCTDTVIKTITVNDTPRVIISPYAYICRGQSINLLAKGGITYQWDFNADLSCIYCDTPLVTPSKTTIYRVIGTDANHCQAQDTVMVRVMPNNILLGGILDTLCAGESIRLAASGKTLYTWTPTTGLNATRGPNVIASAINSIRYKVIGTDSLNCFPDSAFYNLTVYPIPTVDIIESKISAITSTVVSLLTTSSPDVIGWTWTPSSFLSCIDCAQPTATVTRRVNYKATVYNAGGCTASDQVSIEPLCNGENIFIPNTFSPNNDGQNDYFFPRGKGLFGIKSMKIFNRWGEVMFERKDFGVNIAAQGWDGSFRGKMLTPDVYVYLIDVICDNNEIISLKGNITLLK